MDSKILLLTHIFYSYKEATNQYICQNEKNKERFFMYFPFLYHPGLKKINQKKFFKTLRKYNISFDF